MKSEAESEPRGPLEGEETILLADDEESVRILAVTMLERLGYSVIQAADGQDAFTKWRAQAEDIDLLIADLSMPNMSGYELVRRVRSEDAKVPILIASGYGQDHLLGEVLQDNVAFLQKPYRAKQIAAAARSLLDAEARKRSAS